LGKWWRHSGKAKKTKPVPVFKLKGELIPIQYFAVRNEQGCCTSVVEVSPEINEIRDIQSKQQLLA
jgi:DUF438 domain-containing protein